MTWIRIDDGFAEHPKVMALSDRAFRLHVSALCYCGRNLTDGYIAPQALRMLMAGCAATRRHLNELVAAGVWDDTETIHDFNDLNPTAEEVREKREKRRDAGRLGGLAKARASATETANGDASPAFRAPVPALPVTALKAVDDELVLEVDRLLKHVRDIDDGTRGVLLSVARKLPLASVAKVRESCQTRSKSVSAGYAVNALKSELAELEEIA